MALNVCYAETLTMVCVQTSQLSVSQLYIDAQAVDNKSLDSPVSEKNSLDNGPVELTIIDR